MFCCALSWRWLCCGHFFHLSVYCSVVLSVVDGRVVILCFVVLSVGGGSVVVVSSI